MKLREEVIIAPNSDESILVDASGKFKGMIKLNQTASFIATCFQSDISIEEAVNKLMEEYEVDLKTAKDAVESFVNKISEVGLFE